MYYVYILECEDIILKTSYGGKAGYDPYGADVGHHHYDDGVKYY